MGSAHKPAIYTIPAHRGFADALAVGLIERFADPDRGLSGGTILVPNNRASRALSEAFVRRAEPGLLLPRMVPVGDPDLGEALGYALEPIGEDIPAAIDPLERRMKVARLVQQRYAIEGEPVSAPEALRLGEQFARALDQLLVEQLDAGALDAIKTGLEAELGQHYRKSLQLFTDVAEQWNAELAEIGRIDLTDRRNRLLASVAKTWRDNPPAGFIVAVGITTAAPAVARLLRTVAALPDGLVVLPDLDITMPEEEWSSIGLPRRDSAPDGNELALETHPQFHLKLLLDRMGIAREEVMRWARSGDIDAPARRAHAISNAFAPPEATAKWRDLSSNQRSLAGIRTLMAVDSAEEAQAIAILIREALEQPGKRAALVTPDRELARRVSAHLGRWGIEADDSAGRPLSERPPGTLLLALADAAAQDFAPVALLAMLKHPLVKLGEPRLGWLDHVRYLDLLLRGPRTGQGLSAITKRIPQDRKLNRDPARRDALAAWWTGTAAMLAPLEYGPRVTLEARLAALREVADNLSDGAIWRGREGRMLADRFADLEAAAGQGPRLSDSSELPEWLTAMLSDVAVRPAWGGHPRVAIYGLLEARLQQADLMICGGLNEGTWPGLPQPDPWLAPRIRRELGLPALERTIGLAAHDLAGMMGAPEVVLTRAKRDRSGPTVASRFLLRLQAMAGRYLRHDEHALALARAIDRPDGPTNPVPRPAPDPTASQRKVVLNITDLDRLKADPYAFYARRILGLSALDPVDADPTPAWRGTAVHDILEAWAKQDDCDPAKLHERAVQLLDEQSAHPLMRALWQPRLLAAIDWIAEETIRLQREEGRTIAAVEQRGHTMLGDIRITGRADRIDRCVDGSLVVIDYKTGQPPSASQVRAGYALQLGLTGIILESGGIEGIEGRPLGFEYWSLAKAPYGPRKGELGYVDTPIGRGRKEEAIDAEDFTTHAHAHAMDAIALWLTGREPFTAKLHPEYAPYGDYDQLMRLDEWYGRDKTSAAPKGEPGE